MELMAQYTWVFSISKSWIEDYKRELCISNARKRSLRRELKKKQLMIINLLFFVYMYSHIYIAIYHDFIASTVVNFFCCRGLFGRGVSSTAMVLVRRLQFPLNGASAADPCTLMLTVELQNSCTLGLSFLPPLALWWPKNASRGSWQKRSESRNCTPAFCSKNLATSVKDFTVVLCMWCKRKGKCACTSSVQMHMYAPVILNPSNVS